MIRPINKQPKEQPHERNNPRHSRRHCYRHRSSRTLGFMVVNVNNPPAFPTATLAQKTEGGMTLRDYFAAKAMQGYISAKAWHPDFVYSADFNFDAGKRAADAVAVSAYKWADAMMKAREQ